MLIAQKDSSWVEDGQTIMFADTRVFVPLRSCISLVMFHGMAGNITETIAKRLTLGAVQGRVATSVRFPWTLSFA